MAHSTTVRPEMDALESALSLVERGFPVFPADGKAPLIPKGFHAASWDKETIESWWTDWPYANVAIRTGVTSNLVVLDIDPRHGGIDSLQTLEAEIGPLHSLEVITGGGGRHLYFQHPGPTIRSRPFKGYPGIDIKADGGYVIGPGSTHPDTGKPYTFINPDTRIASIPEALLAKIHALDAPGVFEAEDHVPEGGRNDYLTRLAGVLRRRNLSEATIRATLEAENRTKFSEPLSNEEVAKIAESIGNRPGHPYLLEGGHSQVEYAARFVRYGSKETRYVPGLGWIAFDGSRWLTGLEASRMVRGKCVAMLRDTLALASTIRDADKRREEALQEEFRKNVRSRMSKMNVDGILDFATSEAGMLLPIDRLDANPWLLNFPNGTYDLAADAFREHRPEDFITKAMAVDYDPAATALKWEAVTLAVYGKDTELARFDQKWLGHAVSGDMSEHIFGIAHGDGQNGKSTRLNTVRMLMGSYAATLPFSSFDSRRMDDGKNHDLAGLRGVRFVFATESGQDRALDEARIKAISGGDSLRCRFLHQEFFEFAPEFKVILATNHRPTIRGQDHGIWRRIHLFPYEQRFEEGAENKNLKNELRAEYSGIVNWLIEGVRLWRKEGLKPPAAVQMAIEGYKDENDPLGEFLEDFTELKPEAFTPSATLYGAFRAWRIEQGEDAKYIPSAKSFGKLLASRRMTDGTFLRSERDSKSRGFRGLALRPNPATFGRNS